MASRRVEAHLAKCGNMYACKRCQVSTSRVSMIIHVVQNHLEEDQVPFLCKACPDTKGRNRFRSKEEATKHHRARHERMAFKDLFVGTGKEFTQIGSYATALSHQQSVEVVQKKTEGTAKKSDKKKKQEEPQAEEHPTQPNLPVSTHPAPQPGPSKIPEKPSTSYLEPPSDPIVIDSASSTLPYPIVSLPPVTTKPTPLAEQLALSPDDEPLSLHPEMSTFSSPASVASATGKRTLSPSLPSQLPPAKKQKTDPFHLPPPLMSISLSTPTLPSFSSLPTETGVVPAPASVTVAPVRMTSTTGEVTSLLKYTTELHATNRGVARVVNTLRDVAQSLEEISTKDDETARAVRGFSRELHELNKGSKQSQTATDKLTREIHGLNATLKEVKTMLEEQGKTQTAIMHAVIDALHQQTAMFQQVMTGSRP
jgi:hypothetical protein